MNTRLLFLVPALLLAPIADAGERQQYRGQPRELGVHAPGVGEWFPDLAFTDAKGEASKLSAVTGEKGLVIAMRDPDCPLSQKYSPRLVELTKELSKQGFGVLLVNTLSEDSAKADLEAFEFTGTYAIDTEEALPKALDARTTTEVFVLDAARTLRYRGMIDDQYGLGFNKPAPTREYLREAAGHVAAGTRVAMPATEAQGCLFKFEEGETGVERPITYHERISRIVAAKCLECHREGGPGPFALETFEQVKKKKGMIEWVVEDRLMPPWFAKEGSGPWANDMGMSDLEREDFIAWINSKTPEGDPAHAAKAPSFSSGWTIGEPDLIVALPEAITVPADGVVDYQYVYAETGLEEARWVKAVEIRPGAPEVVHHALVFVESPEVLEALQKGDRSRGRFQEGSDSFFASTVPGQHGLVFPEGTGKLLPAGAWLKFQMHYTTNGTEQTDRTEVGFVFSDEMPGRIIETSSAIEPDLAIPPYAFDHEVTASFRFPLAAEMLSLFPHTHLRGSRFLYKLEIPGKGREELLMIPYYDFNWQLNYEFATPLSVPAGTVLHATAWYDNSKENPANPAPDEWVRFGEQTFEEMMIGYVNWIPARAE